MATYTHEQASTKRFYFDIDSSFPITVAMPSIIEDSFASLKGVVVNVVGRIGMRVTAGGASLDGVEFILFQYFSGCIPSQWALKGDNCYRPTKTTDRQTFPQKYNSSPDSFKPYILARSERFSGYWSGEKYHTMNFTPTDLGKNIENWTGRICLAVVYYDAGSAHTYWCWNKEVGRYTLQYAQESPLSGLESSTFKLGKESKVTIAPYSNNYKHKVTWSLGNNSYTTENFIAAGTTTASYTIPTSWRANFGQTENTKNGTVSIETFESDGTKIGETKTYTVLYTIDDYNYNNSFSAPSITKVSGGTRYDNSIFSNYIVSNYDSFKINIKTKDGGHPSNYSTIGKQVSAQYNNTTKNVSVSTGSIDTSIQHKAASGNSNIVLKITDARNKTGTYNTTFNSIRGNYHLLSYTAPNIGTIEYYRGKNSSGDRDDTNGKFGIIKISNYIASKASSPTASSVPAITNTITAKLKDDTGSVISTKNVTKNVNTNSSILFYFENLNLDKEYEIEIIVTDLSDFSNTYSGKIFSSNYLLHFRYSGESLDKQKSIGIGQAGRDLSSENTNYKNYANTGLLSIAYPIELSRGLDSLTCFINPIAIRDGGTGANDASAALKNLGALSTSGGVLTGNLTISRTDSTSGGIYLKDSTGATPGALYYNGNDDEKNLWIGSTASKAAHHRGGTYISTGYNGTNGNDSIYISIPNASNNDSFSYKVYHAGNIFYSADSTADGTPDSIPGGTAIEGMIWLKPIT